MSMPTATTQLQKRALPAESAAYPSQHFEEPPPKRARGSAAAPILIDDDDDYEEDQRALDEMERSHVSDTVCLDSKAGSCAAPGTSAAAVQGGAAVPGGDVCSPELSEEQVTLRWQCLAASSLCVTALLLTSPIALAEASGGAGV